MNAYIANFNSEAFWRDEQLTRLPAMVDDQADSIVGVMDDLQFVFCDRAEDLVVTRVPMNSVHTEYLAQIGIRFATTNLQTISGDEINVGYLRKNIFELLNNSPSCFSQVDQADRLSPFAIIPSMDKLLSSKNVKNSFPDIGIVKKVNSKEFSHFVTKDIFGTAIGTMIYSSDDLVETGHRLLKEGAFLIKDIFGVSGKGNLKIDSEIVLQRVVKYLKKQEKEGKSTRFLVEPFLDKAFDFCCQFTNDTYGNTTIISTHKLSNSGFSYSGSKKIDERFQSVLENAGYFDTMQKVGNRLFSEGYFGDVCIDSLMLTDNTIVPIVEINARKSMSLINHYVDRYLLSNYNKSGSLLSYTLNVPVNLRFDDFFNCLKSDDILFRGDSPQGLIPLSANTFDINRPYANAGPDKPLFYKGQFYASLVADSDDKKNDIMTSMNAMFSKLGIRII